MAMGYRNNVWNCQHPDSYSLSLFLCASALTNRSLIPRVFALCLLIFIPHRSSFIFRLYGTLSSN